MIPVLWVDGLKIELYESLGAALQVGDGSNPGSGVGRRSRGKAGTSLAFC